MSRPPLPPFTETDAQKVRMAEDAWNSRDPARVALGPLASPARAQSQVIGAPSEDYAEIMAEAKPARAVVPVLALHHGYLIEIEAIARRVLS